MLTLGGLVAAAAEPSLRMLAAPLGGVLLLVLVFMAFGSAGRPPEPPRPVPLAAPRPDPAPLDGWSALTPREFELQVAAMFSRLPGWQAEATRGRADQGADVLLTGPGGGRVAVQVKRYRSAVGNGAVQAIVASKALYGCQHALVVTCGPGYTRAARELAQANGVTLWTAAELDVLRHHAERGLPLPPGLALPG